MVTKLIETQSGSIYELDVARRLVRRVVRSSVSEAERPGTGEWRGYESAELPRIGVPFVIVWGTDVDDKYLTTIHTTVTSPVAFVHDRR